MLPLGSLAGNAASALGLMAAAIAVFGFLTQAPAALARKDDQALRIPTVIGGLVGFVVACAIVMADVW